MANYPLNRPPKELGRWAASVSVAVERWFNDLRRLLTDGNFPWSIIDKTGSKLEDIETRPHSQLTDVAGSTDQVHVATTERAELTALDALTTGIVAKTGDATYVARTITAPAAGIIISDGDGVSGNPTFALANDLAAVEGLSGTGVAVRTADDTWTNRTIIGTSGEITVTNGDGVSDNPTISLPTTISGPRRFGGETDYTEFEVDGTIEFNGAATVWEDLNFDPVRSGGPAATRPDDVTINNVYHKEFTSANNQTCGSNEEVPHHALLGGTFYPHAHVFLKAGESSGTTGVTFTFYWELRQSTGTTSNSVTLSATSAGLAANAHKVNIFDAIGFTGPTELGANLACRIDRTSGDAGDVIVMTYGIHYIIDTVGSRSMTSK